MTGCLVIHDQFCGLEVFAGVAEAVDLNRVGEYSPTNVARTGVPPNLYRSRSLGFATVLVSEIIQVGDRTQGLYGINGEIRRNQSCDSYLEVNATKCVV
jgi:ABC-type anion transport system duplicated permease subunit